MAAKKSRTLQRKSKVRVPKTNKPQRAKLPISAADLEGVLLQGMSSQKNPLSSSHVLPELLYNITPSMRGLGYLSGFRAGLKLSSKSASRTIHPLIMALENAGFSKILYHPTKQHALIRASHSPDCETGARRSMHIFEAGLIAGYLTEFTAADLKVTESKCVHKGDAACQFIAERNPQISEVNTFESVEELVEEIHSALRRKRIEGRTSAGYFALQMLPFASGPINSEISKLLYVAGERVGSQLPKINEQTAEKLCALFGLRKVKIEKGRRAVSAITATHMPSNSFAGYSQIVSSFISGMLYGKYGKIAKVERRLLGDGSYSVELAI